MIPLANPGVMMTGGVDVRYAATYGNPYLRGSNGPSLCKYYFKIKRLRENVPKH